tara:strand:- start:1037 stop:1639 length:603 start_codon:yes stop_codon:yes gene_type:complete
MADPLTYSQLLENSREIDELLQSPELNEEEKEDLEYIWNSLKSREESKFDAIISLIKDCDKQILIRDKEITELKRNQNYWKNKRKKIINIIKKAYEEHLINSMPTGNKYEATIKQVKSRLIDSYKSWNSQEIKEFGLFKTTMTKKISDNSTVNWKEETLPDKKAVRDSLEANDGKAPKDAHLSRKFSLTYNLRKRLRIGI